MYHQNSLVFMLIIISLNPVQLSNVCLKECLKCRSWPECLEGMLRALVSFRRAGTLGRSSLPFQAWKSARHKEGVR